ncbi:hypothetical protein [Treponema saccharophilum]|uniref:hypothetical protein n=1 Tax=Treponema saccharophilum TaxID=165 RepID=UPI00059293C2
MIQEFAHPLHHARNGVLPIFWGRLFRRAGQTHYKIFHSRSDEKTTLQRTLLFFIQRGTGKTLYMSKNAVALFRREAMFVQKKIVCYNQRRIFVPEGWMQVSGENKI